MSRESAIPAPRYHDAGVDIAAGDAFVDAIRPLAASTARAGTLDAPGGFAALFDPRAAGFADPVLAGATDGVGTKLKLAAATGEHAAVGADLVAMCVNDLAVHGAQPLFFLDYYATGRLDPGAATSVVRGIAAACRTAGCALVGGETAEMPGMYAPGDYELAGFALGAAERGEVLTGEAARPGDAVLGLESDGVHANGFSLVRKLIGDAGLPLDGPAPFDPDRTLGAALMTPTRIYVPAARAALAAGGVRAMAHVTGGGLAANLGRVLPDGVGAELDARHWPLPPVLGWLHQGMGVPAEEMLRTFNCGIGYCIVAAPDRADSVASAAREAGERVHHVGTLTDGGAVRVTGAETAWRA